MITFLREAGVGVLPVLLFGVVTLGLAIGYARRPNARLLVLVLGFGAMTLLFSALGFFVGIQASASFVESAAEADRWMFVVGVRESLNNLVAGLLFVIVSAAATTAGAVRAVAVSQSARAQVARDLR